MSGEGKSALGTRRSALGNSALGNSAPPPPECRVPSPERLSLRHELTRKALHLLTASVPISYAAGLPRRWVVALLALACGVALAVEWGRARHEAMRALFHRATGRLIRAHEHERWAGATWLLLAFLGVAVLFPRDVAVAAMWGVAVGDAAAALVGRAIGRLRVAGSAKTLEGSAACFAVTLGGALLVARLPLAEGAVAAAAATLAEWPGRPLDDNVRMAASIGCGILLWRIAFS
jgi:dolichol kinase